jgi:hypothetical protein
LSFLIWINLCYVLTISFSCAAGVMNVRETLMSFSTLNVSLNFSSLCYCWSWFHSHGSYVHRVFTLFLLHIVCFCFFFGLYLLVLLFALHFRWMGPFQFLILISRVFLVVFFLMLKGKHAQSTGCPTFLRYGWILTEWIFSFTLVTTAVRNRALVDRQENG